MKELSALVIWHRALNPELIENFLKYSLFGKKGRLFGLDLGKISVCEVKMETRIVKEF